jgi:signal peptidase II
VNKILNIVLILLLAIFIDQFSKFLAGFLGLKIIFNEGVSLGLLGNLSSVFLAIFSFLILLLIFIFLKKDWLFNPIASGLFFGGAISNIVDRIFYGSVRDWLKIPFFEIYNNLADWFIFVGLGWFLVVIWWTSNKKSKKLV